MNAATLERIREQSHRAARSKIAQEVGEIILGDSIETVERDWCRRYVLHWLRALTYYTALELSGNDHSAARDILASKEVQDEIGARLNFHISEVLQ